MLLPVQLFLGNRRKHQRSFRMKSEAKVRNGAEDPVFKRLGDDLYIDVEVDLYSAVLGGEKVVDTLDGKVKLKIKPETQNGTKVRLKGKGFPVYKKEGQFGDLIVTYSVKIPTNLTDKQKELFRQLQSMN